MGRDTLYRCLNCGERFKAFTMTRREAEEEQVQLSPVRCPSCGRTDLREGWE